MTIGRPDLRLRDIRHTGLTLAAATGATTAELMHRAGRASVAAAIRYQRATRDRDRRLSNALELMIPDTKLAQFAELESSFGVRSNE